MHNCDLDIGIKKLSKIEGHADLDIRIRNGKLEDVSLKVMENVRFFNQAVVGKNCNSVPQLVSRICGTCSIAHLTCCIEAVEKALGITPSEQTLLLRKLTMYSLMIRDHALHLYFFVLPDMLGIDSILDLPDDQHELIHEALAVKEAGNNLSQLVAGRAVHAPFEQVGGFSREIDKLKIPAVLKELENIRPLVLKLIERLADSPWNFERETNFVALCDPDFSFLEGVIKSSDGSVIQEKDFGNHLQSVVLPYSQASSFEFKGREYMVGALARLNLGKDNLHPRTKKDAVKYLDIFPSRNVYHNNLAQAIEILHSIDHSLELLENSEFRKESIVKPEKMTGEGVGVIEAPRGTLYYWLGIKDGKVQYANLVIPTAQNLVNMREDVRKIVGDMCVLESDPKKLEERIRAEVEKFIRAYDPCMSCASHFLRVKLLR